LDDLQFRFDTRNRPERFDDIQAQSTCVRNNNDIAARTSIYKIRVNVAGIP
jgi:hypothetical protein